MKLRLQYFAILAFLFLVPFVSNIFAQGANPLEPEQKNSPVLMGPSFGINKSLHTVNLTTYSDASSINDVLCPKFESGSSTGFYVGWNIEFFLTKQRKDVASSIIARLLYNTLPASMELNDFTGNKYPSKDPVTNKEVFTQTNYKNEIKYSLITLEAQYRLSLFGSRLSFLIGPTFDFALTKQQDITMNLVGEPLNATFVKQEGYTYRNNDRTIAITPDPEIPNASALRIGIKGGFQYEIEIGKGTLVCPNVQYNFGLTNLQSENNWRVNAIQAGFDVRFSFFK